MLSIPEQVKELNDQLNYYEAEKLRIVEKMRKIQDREKEGKIYGTEAADLKDLDTQLRKTCETITAKEKEHDRLKIQLESAKQTAFL